MNVELVEFTRRALATGIGRKEIADTLRRAGWAEHDIKAAMGASRPRKWLTYLTLFVAGAFLVGDAATLVYNALGGELTIRFVLKVATIAIIAGGIFTFFLSEMRKDERV